MLHDMSKPRAVLRSREAVLRSRCLEPRSCSRADSRSRSRGHRQHEHFATASTGSSRSWRNPSRTRLQPQGSLAREVYMDSSSFRKTIQDKSIILCEIDGVSWTSKKYGIRHELEQLFNERGWRDRSMPMFSSFSNYLETLPVRRLGDRQVLKLFELPFFCKEVDLACFAHALTEGNSRRHTVSYLCAASCSGKTASVLVGFIESARTNGGLERYIYLPFSNNEGRYHHSVKCSGCIDNSGSNESTACNLHGANFMLACLESAVHVEWVRSTWTSPGYSLESVRFKYVQIVSNILRTSSDDKLILLHVDEHRKMSTCPHFRRGALTLAATGNVRVIATYTEPPDVDPTTQLQSSELCRVPVAKLPVHIASLLAWLGLDYWTTHSFSDDASTWRKLNALHISIGLVFDVLGLASIHAQHRDHKQQVFFQGFTSLIESSHTSQEFISDSLQFCKETWGTAEAGYVERLAELMCGLNDAAADLYLSNDSGKTSSIKSPLVVAGNCLTAPLHVLLRNFPLAEPACVSDLYCTCRDLFVESITKSDDYSSGQVLERAYLWSIACMFAGSSHKPVVDDMFKANFSCQGVSCGQILEVQGHQLKLSCNAHKYLKPNMLFYSDESDSSHPRCDMWFMAPRNSIWIIEIGGTGRDEEARTKVTRTEEAIRTLSKLLPDCTVSGVVLLPNHESVRVISTSSVCHVYSAVKAQRLLGGLKQILPFMKATN